ncbi:MAG: hypothetical protein A2018_05330 [Alphaproteobacteria bacterium GWF2_58_20]|nr:MAG: hypothetical protein A2018_05330 [Alphaproteobacteria bacterium GWF2_58_20]
MTLNLSDWLVGGVLGTFAVFCRVGSAIMVMPGFGDLMSPAQARLLFAIMLSFVLAPALVPVLGPLPTDPAAILLFMMLEVAKGLFAGLVVRMMMSALENAGAIISYQMGLANAAIFNPQMATQGSLAGALLSVAGVVILFVSGMHHMLIRGVIESYNMLPAGFSLPVGDMGKLVVDMAAKAFLMGVELGAPFLVVGFVLQLGMGLLNRLMPQLQIFFMATPAQVGLGILMLAFSISAILSFWLVQMEDMLSTVFLG